MTFEEREKQLDEITEEIRKHAIALHTLHTKIRMIMKDDAVENRTKEVNHSVKEAVRYLLKANSMGLSASWRLRDRNKPIVKKLVNE